MASPTAAVVDFACVNPEDIARLSVAELRVRLLDRGQPLSEVCEEALSCDSRAGAREVLRQVLRRRRDNRCEGQRLRHLLRYEVELWEKGLVHVAGVDEAGMAPLAGPVVAGACILPHDYRPRGIDDSKQLDRAERERLAEDIQRNAVAWATARAEVEEIDSLNIYHAGLLALTRAVRGLGLAPEHVLVDARKLPQLGHRAHSHRPRGRALADHRGGQHPGQDHPRRAHVRAGSRSPRVRLLEAQGLPDLRALRGARPAGRLPRPPPFLRAGAPGARPRADPGRALRDGGSVTGDPSEQEPDPQLRI